MKAHIDFACPACCSREIGSVLDVARRRQEKEFEEKEFEIQIQCGKCWSNVRVECGATTKLAQDVIELMNERATRPPPELVTQEALSAADQALDELKRSV